MHTDNPYIAGTQTAPFGQAGDRSEEQLDWVEQLRPTYLVIGPTRSGKTRLADNFEARVISAGGDHDQV